MLMTSWQAQFLFPYFLLLIESFSYTCSYGLLCRCWYAKSIKLCFKTLNWFERIWSCISFRSLTSEWGFYKWSLSNTFQIEIIVHISFHTIHSVGDSTTYLSIWALSPAFSQYVFFSVCNIWLSVLMLWNWPHNSNISYRKMSISSLNHTVRIICSKQFVLVFHRLWNAHVVLISSAWTLFVYWRWQSYIWIIWVPRRCHKLTSLPRYRKPSLLPLIYSLRLLLILNLYKRCVDSIWWWWKWFPWL